MRKSKLIFMIFVLGVIGLASLYTGSAVLTTVPTSQENPWKVHTSAAPSDSLRVEVGIKYGPTMVVFCRVVFESPTAYRLDGLGADKLDFQKSNLTFMKVEKLNTPSSLERN